MLRRFAILDWPAPNLSATRGRYTERPAERRSFSARRKAERFRQSAG